MVQYNLPADKVLADLAIDSSCGSWIHKVHEHDSLLQVGEDEELTEDERAKAWDDYVNNRDLLRDRPTYPPAPVTGRRARVI